MRSRFYNALGGVRLCTGDMDAYASYGLSCGVFRRYDDVCVGALFGRCLLTWKREESVGWSVRGECHTSLVTNSLWLWSRQYLVCRQYVSVQLLRCGESSL
jgi:hypothetical protein